jgi:prevent-host-death family protein
LISNLIDVVTCDYIELVKTKSLKYTPSEASETAVMREAGTPPDIGTVVSVRSAKAHLSALLEMVASGREITITSDGEPKAILSPVGKRQTRKVFTGTREHLKQMPPWRGGPTAEETIREDRDGRGW